MTSEASGWSACKNASEVIEIRYKTVVYTVKGELSTICRRCNTPNFYDTRIRTTEPLGVSA